MEKKRLVEKLIDKVMPYAMLLAVLFAIVLLIGGTTMFIRGFLSSDTSKHSSKLEECPTIMTQNTCMCACMVNDEKVACASISNPEQIEVEVTPESDQPL